MKPLIIAPLALLAFSATLSHAAPSSSYVSDGYFKRKQGYDWTAVETTTQADDTLKVKIRSRADKKKPTCTFDGVAYPVSSNLYQLKQGDMTLNLTVNANTMSITTDQDSDRNKAMTYCSGGGSLIGTYKQVAKLDRTHLDNTKFIQTLSLQNISFVIEHKADTVTIRSHGLTHEFDEKYTIKGQRITHAEVEDMNRDGYPELLIYLQNIKKPHRGDVLAFSANGNQSLSQMRFIPAKDNPELRPYYRGGDEFGLIEHRLAHRFPEYINGKATGRTKQVTYEVQDGEASRQLVIVK